MVLAAFKNVYAFRPGFMRPTKGLKHTHRFYKIFTLTYPLWKTIFPSYVSTLSEVGLAMINSVTKGYEKSILEVKDIVDLARG